MFWKNKSDQSVTEEKILEILKQLKPAPDAQDIVSAGMVSDIIIKDGAVMFSISVPAERAESFEPLRERAEAAVAALDGVKKAMVVLTAERAQGSGQGSALAAPKRPTAKQPPKGGGKIDIAGVKQIIAIFVGKGRCRQVHHSRQSCSGATGQRSEGLGFWMPTFTARRSRAFSRSQTSQRLCPIHDGCIRSRPMA